MSDNEEFLKRLKQIFKVEAQENLDIITNEILTLEKNPDNKESIELILRQTHSLKGSARSVSIIDIVNICQSLESVFVLIKNDQLDIPDNFFDIIHNSINLLKKVLNDDSQKYSIFPVIKEINGIQSFKKKKEVKLSIPQKNEIKNDFAEAPTIENNQIEKELIEENKNEILKKPIVDQENILAANSVKKSETVRIDTDKLDKLLIQSEDMLSIKLNSEYQFRHILHNNKIIEEYFIDQDKLYHEAKKLLVNLKNVDINIFHKLNEIIENHSKKEKIIKDSLDHLIDQAEQNKNEIETKIDNILKEVKMTLMFPFSSILSALPIMIRDISKDLNKEVELAITGSEIEIDKRILEELKDPLIHLIRNSIDHGLEAPDKRKGKPSQGTIKINIQQNDSRVEIKIYDDGKGLDYQKIKQKIIDLEIVNVQEVSSYSTDELKQFIFHSGLSTSSIITDISGRGLGLAIVKEKIEKIGGSINVNSEKDKFTEFIISLPLTLSTFRGLLVKTSEKLFVIPLTAVDKVKRVKIEDIKTVEGKRVVNIDNEILSCFYLSDILGIKYSESHKRPKYIQTVIISTLGKSLALWVDEILYEQEVMIKTLGKQLVRVKNISGLTLLGSGQNIPLINVRDIFESVSSNNYNSAAITNAIIKAKKKSRILIAEDSITSRTLLTNILESAGYTVKAVIDGLEAYLTLETEEFDLLISDVEMPRMNGFDLTTKVRSNKNLTELPVILITSLSSKEHKEKGVEVGANAYIVKSELEQENLLNIIPRLL